MINITLFTKIIYDGHTIDSEILPITVDEENDLNPCRIHRTQKKMTETKAADQGLACDLLSATYFITWSNSKIKKRLASYSVKDFSYLTEVYIKQLIPKKKQAGCGV